jgi:hypothetical protein
MGFSVVSVKLYGWKIKDIKANEYINNTKNIEINNEYILDYFKFDEFYIIKNYNDYGRKHECYLSIIKPIQEITAGRGHLTESDSDSDSEFYELEPKMFNNYDKIREIAFKLGSKNEIEHIGFSTLT